MSEIILLANFVAATYQTQSRDWAQPEQVFARDRGRFALKCNQESRMRSRRMLFDGRHVCNILGELTDEMVVLMSIVL